jgi:hypothetical protein
MSMKRSIENPQTTEQQASNIMLTNFKEGLIEPKDFGLLFHVRSKNSITTFL